MEGGEGYARGIEGKRGQAVPELERGSGEEQSLGQELSRLKVLKGQVSCQFGNKAVSMQSTPRDFFIWRHLIE
jgi:hypothetical protein